MRNNVSAIEFATIRNEVSFSSSVPLYFWCSCASFERKHSQSNCANSVLWIFSWSRSSFLQIQWEHQDILNPWIPNRLTKLNLPVSPTIYVHKFPIHYCFAKTLLIPFMNNNIHRVKTVHRKLCNFQLSICNNVPLPKPLPKQQIYRLIDEEQHESVLVGVCGGAI